jgi:hypothetical protein
MVRVGLGEEAYEEDVATPAVGFTAIISSCFLLPVANKAAA